MVLMGVLAVEDALRAMKEGVDGIWVSKHGGRQFDGAPSPVRILPEMRRALGGDTLLIVDSGIRSGLDIARMLSLGADFTMLGRPFLFGTAALGEAGATHVVDILKDELTNILAQTGCRNPTEPRALQQFGVSE